MFSMRFTLLIALMGMLLSSTLGAKLSFAADDQHSIPIPSDEPVHPTNMTTMMTYTITDGPTPSLPFGEPHHISVSLSPPRPHKYHNSSRSHHIAGIVTMVDRDLIPQGMGERRIIPTPPVVPSDEPTHSCPPPTTMNPSSSSSTATKQPQGPSSGDPYHWPNSTSTTTETTTTTTQTVIVMPTGFPFPWPTSYNGSQPHYNTTCWVGSEDMPCRGYLSGCTTRGMLVRVSPFASDHH